MKIPLGDIIQQNGMQPGEVARQLFPSNAHPQPALTRILKGEGSLDEEQVYKLAAMCGCEVSELYTPSNWRISGSPTRVHIFTFGNWKASFDTRTNVTRLYNRDNLKVETVMNSETITLKNYLAALNDLVTKQTNK